MQKEFFAVLLLSTLLILSGCKKTPPVPVPEGSTTAAGQTDATEKTPDSTNQTPADKPDSNLLTLDDGTVLDYKKPELHTRILAVIPNVEKTNYVVVTNCQVAYGSNFTGLQFFRADGSYLRSVSVKNFLEVGWTKDNITYSGDSLRLNGGYFVFYYNLKTRDMLNVDGEFLCTDNGVDLIRNKNMNKAYCLVENFRITDSMEANLNDLNFTEMPEPKQYHFDVKKKIAAIETKHIRYNLDFKTKTVNIERFYTDDDLQDFIGVNDDGTHEVYTACEGAAGDGVWRQVVIKDKKTGKIQFLTYLEMWEFAVLGSNDTVICNHLTSLELFDVKSGKKVENFLDFSFEKNGKIVFCLVGLYYDKEKEQYILAYRDANEAFTGAEGDNEAYSQYLRKKLPVFVKVLDKNGKEVKKIDTDLKINRYDDDGIRTVNIVRNQDHSYTLTANGDEVVIVKT